MELAKTVFLEQDLPYHWFYLSICFFGIVVHEFLFVLLLVSMCVVNAVSFIISKVCNIQTVYVL